MARVTVEDCTKVVPNRFELVLLAAQRARDISAGQEATIERDNDKNAVLALREIALNNVELEDLKANIVRGVNRHDVEVSEDEKLTSLQQAQEENVSEEQVGGLSFTELEQEDAPAITEDQVLAAAEDLFVSED
ncbi:MAG: DNA-directed RNA polymerase subunit omega [Proteobacteria bacterium]|nr:MAG: DNA-directed RNA polymerase subunit omega [Pseudomonadota bacterium]|tara:strand:+ start:146 stop:547 length:402 start_codon:yes stop_codon:yes gene_type:complete